MNTSHDYGEPWKVTTIGKGTLVTRDGAPVVEHLLTVERAIKCSSALAGIPDPEKWVEAAKAALEKAAAINTAQDCPIENHGISVSAMEAISLLTSPSQ